MEEKIFRLPAVAAELDRLIEARLHTDGTRNLERILALQQRFTGVQANPFYVLLDPASETIVARFGGATRDDAVFAEFLRQRAAPVRP